jgi:hypothetical protein
VGPVLLGELAFEALGQARQEMRTWRLFREIVEANYGLDEETRL